MDFFTVSDWDGLLSHAVSKYASDLHGRIERDQAVLRLRCDGQLIPLGNLSLERWKTLSNQIKLRARLDITETRRPQSGHFQSSINGHDMDFRLSTHPTLWGESLSLRLLERKKTLRSLSELGFTDDQQSLLTRMIHFPQGLILLCGPTGSGKTTTLYALLSLLDREKMNIMTLEDPVEYDLPGIHQTEVVEGILGYAEGIRSILRQDPDIILLGEIRDEDTARMALRAALTGHLVLTTLHTFDTFSVPGRLKDLGISPALLASCLRGVVSQRLIRGQCRVCKTEGCAECSETGYSGRSVVAEIWDLSLVSQNHLLEELSPLRLRETESSLFSIWDHGYKKNQAEETTWSEVIRILGDPPPQFTYF